MLLGVASATDRAFLNLRGVMQVSSCDLNSSAKCLFIKLLFCELPRAQVVNFQQPVHKLLVLNPVACGLSGLGKVSSGWEAVQQLVRGEPWKVLRPPRQELCKQLPRPTRAL